jgi:hypothetical protein
MAVSATFDHLERLRISFAGFGRPANSGLDHASREARGSRRKLVLDEAPPVRAGDVAASLPWRQDRGDRPSFEDGRGFEAADLPDILGETRQQVPPALRMLALSPAEDLTPSSRTATAARSNARRSLWSRGKASSVGSSRPEIRREPATAARARRCRPRTRPGRRRSRARAGRDRGSPRRRLRRVA